MENGTRPAEEGEDRSAWTNLTRRKPTTTSARNGPNLPGERRTQEHMKKEEKGTHGELVNDKCKCDASTLACKSPLVRLNGQNSSHNPLDSWRVQPSNYVRNWTSPTTKKERRTTPKACPETSKWIHVMMHLVCQALEQRWKNGC